MGQLRDTYFEIKYGTPLAPEYIMHRMVNGEW